MAHDLHRCHPHARRNTVRAVLIAGAMILCWAALAHARPPPGAAQSPEHSWWEGAQQPGSGISCCGRADGRRVPARVLNGRWQALVDGSWRDVPPDVILWHYPPNAAGTAAVWIVADTIFCFVPPGAGS